MKRVYVRDDEMAVMTLRSDYHIVLGHRLNASTEVPVDPLIYTIGSDGRRIIVLHLLLHSYTIIVPNLPSWGMVEVVCTHFNRYTRGEKLTLYWDVSMHVLASLLLHPSNHSRLCSVILEWLG